MAREKTWQFDMNRQYLPTNQSPSDTAKYILWYYKAFLCGQIGACFTVLASVITVATPGAAGTLANGTYYYQVTALNGGNESVASNEVPVVVSAGGVGSVALTWTAVAGATGYRVYRGTAAGVENVFYAPGNVTTYTDTNAASTGGTPPAIGSWVVLGSSDGTSGAMDGLDRWTSTYTAGKLNRNTAGSAHSWMVLRGPTMAGKVPYILIDYSNGGGDNFANFTLGFTVAPVGGTVNNAPVTQNPTNTIPNPFSTNPGSTPIVQSVRVHGQLAADGSFNILTSKDFTARFLSGFMVHLLADYKVSDGYPVWMMVTAETAIQNPGTGFAAGLATSAYAIDYALNSAMRYPDNSGNGRVGLITALTTNIPALVDAFDGSSVDFPTLVGSKVVNNMTLRGRVQDLYYVGTAIGSAPPTGSVDDPTTPQYMVVGLWWFPTNAIPNIY